MTTQTSSTTDTQLPRIHWTENGVEHSAVWRSENGAPPPKRVVIADDTTTADVAYRLVCEGTALLWRGDFQNGRQLLQALGRRVDKSRASKPVKKSGKRAAPQPTPPLTETFHLYRQAQSQRARTLGMLLLTCEADYGITLRRAPDVRQACVEAYGPVDEKSEAFVVSLRELQGLVGAHEWRKKGVEVAALGDRIHAHYGVFSPVRGEYVALVADAPLPKAVTARSFAFDIGTGTGVLAAVLAKRGIQRVIATELNPRALACAEENFTRLGLGGKGGVVSLQAVDLFPAGTAPLIVCNPPWLPARPSSTLEQAVYDPDSQMLRGFLNGLAAHLDPGGEGWLILSDLAEHLGLRSREELEAWIEKAGLQVLGRIDTRPQHPKAADETDPLHRARAAERTSLWRLAAADLPAA